MTFTHRLRQLISSYGLAAVSCGVLVVAQGSERLSPSGVLADPAHLLGLALVGTAAAFHRPLGGGTLGLGAAVLPLAIPSLGVIPAAWLAAFSLISLGLLRNRLEVQTTPQVLLERRGTRRVVDGAAQTSLAVVAAGLAWSSWFAIDDSSRRYWAGSLAAGAVFLVVSLLLEVLQNRLRRPKDGLRLSSLLPLSLDGAGWMVGSLLYSVVVTSGWATATLILVTVTLLSLEAARNAFEGKALEGQLYGLQKLRRAHQRMIKSSSEFATLVDQIRVECSNSLPVSWFQFELLNGHAGYRSWCAGPDGHLDEGRPNPAKTPPPLPGIHRRSSWQLIDRELQVRGQTLARLRLWCDPRRVEGSELEVLDMLLPQMAASVERSILDRDAKTDPLTGLAVRRMLEGRLQKGYHRCYEEGGSIAVVLCDVDHFKRINDTYGHDAGDQVLSRVAQILEQCGRDTDLCCRYGGEEFAIVLDGADGATALQIAERVRQVVEGQELGYEGRTIPVTLSSGVAAFPELYVQTATELLLLADAALYAAKDNGRNRSLLHLGRGRFQDASGEVVRLGTDSTAREVSV